MLWLCLNLPLLPLEVFVRDGRSRPAVVAARERGHERVLVCNAPARHAGVRTGMRMSAAWALAPALELHQRSEAREARALNRLAAWCGQFSDFVVLRAPDAVLLEIRGSLRLFGGLNRFLATLERALGELGYAVRTGVAPTPLAASLLARQGGGVVAEGDNWTAHLQRVPVACLQQPATTLGALQDMGVSTLAGCLRLPRDGLARRFGPSLLRYLDRLLGKAAHPLNRFESPDRYAAQLELPAETEAVEALSFPFKRLLLELCGILGGRAAGVQALRAELQHACTPVTVVQLSLVAPSRDAEHLLMLLRDRLERLSLAAPVRGVGLRAERFEALAARSEDLFGGGDDTTSNEHFLDQLRGRLGREAVDGLSCYPEHRPEHAWRVAEPSGARAAVVYPRRTARPLWLLPRPLALETRQGEPCYDGRLTLLAGPERIEGGWWDGGDIARDYFVAGSARGARYWIYQELRQREWFLHGIFA